MRAHRILIAYGTSYGRTAKIAEKMSRSLSDRGNSVTVVRGDELPRCLSLDDFDGVIIGASVTFGHHQRYIERFVRRHRDALNSMPSAFFSVSGSAASPNESQRAVAQRCLDEFLAKTGWRPRKTAAIAGAIAYTKYGAFTRLMLRFASRRSGDTNLCRDSEATDWAQVARFADEFLALVPEPADSTAYEGSHSASRSA